MSGFALPTELLSRLADVQSVGVITGAGVSAESGIRTYRGAGGVYDDSEEGDSMMEALTGSTLRRDPDRTWRAIATVAKQTAHAEPNAAHHAIARIEASVERFVLLTQNVDGLHHQAGSRNVIDIHGSARRTICMSCGEPSTLENLAELDGAPQCASCGGVRRPDAVLFGELLPGAKVAQMQRELYLDPPELVVVAGTSAMFPYIAEPVVRARRANRLTVEINPEPTELSDIVHFSLRAAAGTAFPALAQALAPSASGAAS